MMGDSLTTNGLKKRIYFMCNFNNNIIFSHHELYIQAAMCNFTFLLLMLGEVSVLLVKICPVKSIWKVFTINLVRIKKQTSIDN